MSGEARESARHPARPVIELGCGILVYPPEADGGAVAGGIHKLVRNSHRAACDRPPLPRPNG